MLKHFFMGLHRPPAARAFDDAYRPATTYRGTAIQSPWVGCAMLVVCGILMASRAPTISAKHLRIPAKRVVPVLLAVMFAIGMLVSQFWLTLGVIGLLYLASIRCAASGSCGYAAAMKPSRK